MSFMMFSACEGEPTIDDGIDVSVEKADEETSIEVDMFESQDEDYHLPSALQVASLFKKSGLNYNSGVANSIENAGNYTSSLQQMLNFGVYSADLAYCVINNQPNEARKILGVIKDLATAQGMDAVFDNKDLMERFDANLEIQDSVEMIMFDIHERNSEYLEENDMMHTSSVHYAGAWSEGMYLGVYDFENNPGTNNVGASISEQMEILGNIIKGCEDKKNADLQIDWVINDLNKIKTTYESFESVKAFYADPEATELKLSDEEFKTLGGMIKDLRSKIVNA